MLRAGITAEPLRVMDSRIWWGRIVAVSGAAAKVRVRPLRWDGGALRLGEERGELVTARDGGARADASALRRNWVALHWDWICDVLEPVRFARLSAYTRTQLVVVNHALSRPTARPSWAEPAASCGAPGGP